MAALRSHFRGLASDRNLQRFVVQAISTGRQLGTGSYGSVEEVEVNGLVCAGKKIHEILLDVGNVGVRDIAAKYAQECQLMSDLRHPNITQFLGLCFLPTDCQLPVLVMERLDGSLDDLLETVPNIPLTLKCSMLEDVARGLLYLHNHNPQIIHRDLTAKNVLLTPSLVAKITDFGNSRIVNIQPGQLAQTLSRNPGTLVYMPPEALADIARYGPSMDIFSFGHLGIFVGIQIFPGKLLEPTYPDPNKQESLLGRSEVERRQVYIDQLDRKLPDYGHHPFVQLVKRCLKNTASQRPTAEEVLRSLEEMKAVIDGPCGKVARTDAVRQVVMMREILGRETEVRRKTDELAAKDEEIHQLQQELEQEQAERARTDARLHQQTTELQQAQAERARTEEQLQQVNAQLNWQTTELQQKDVQIQQDQVAKTQLQEDKRQLTAELNSAQQNLQSLHADLEEREARLRTHEEEMKERDAEINRLLGELRQCQSQLHVLQQQEELSQWRKGQPAKQTPLEELKGPLKLKWKQGNDMPFDMFNHIQAVVIGDNVYVGGGYTASTKNRGTVMVYSLNTGPWRMLPPYENQFFGVAAVNNQLVLVGGWSISYGRDTGVVGLWDEGSQLWTHPFPEMPTSRNSPSVVFYQKWLVVAGGSYSTKVELLDTLSGQWYEGPSLPNKCSEMSSAINGNMWYLSRGFISVPTTQKNKHVFSVCLDELISQTVLQTAGDATSQSTSSPWQTLTDTPLGHSTVLVLNGALLAIGGIYSSAIHHYQPNSKRWVKVGDLLTTREMCASTVLPNGEIFVVGGIGKTYQPMRHIDIGRITF